jgi:hypothetical protein
MRWKPLVFAPFLACHAAPPRPASSPVGCTPEDARSICDKLGDSAPPFDRGATAKALGSVTLGDCESPHGPTGSGHLKVTFAPDGSVQSVLVDQPPFAGTTVGACVARKFREIHIPEYAGSAVTVGKSFVVQ